MLAIRDRVGLDLIEIDDPTEFASLLLRPDRLAAVLHIAIGEPPDLPLAALLDELDGETLNAGYWALLEALADFTQPAERGAALRAGIEATVATLSSAALQVAETMASPEVRQAVETQLGQTIAQLRADLLDAGGIT